MVDIIQSLWIGAAFSKLEQLSVKSFLDNGHEYHLYVYDPVENVPAGAIIKDGNEIMDKSEIFRYKNGSIAAFANLFRYTLLYKRGGIWAATDCICVRPFRIEQDIAIASEPTSNYTNKMINCTLLKLGKDSKEAEEGVRIQYEHKPQILAGTITWASGNKTATAIVGKFKLTDSILPWKAINACYYNHFKSLIDPRAHSEIKGLIRRPADIPPEMICIHMFNEMFRRNGIDKNLTYNSDSLFEYFKRKHGI